MKERAIKQNSKSLKVVQLLERKNYTSGYTDNYLTRCFKIGEIIMEKASSNAAIRMSYMISESESPIQDYGDVFFNFNSDSETKKNRIETVAKNPMKCVTEFFAKEEAGTSTEYKYSLYVAIKDRHSKVDLCVNNKFLTNAEFLYVNEAKAEDYDTVTGSGTITKQVNPYMAQTVSSAGNKVNYWAEICKFETSGQWQECDLVLDIFSRSFEASSPIRSCRLVIRVAQSNPLPTNAHVLINMTNAINMSTDDIKAIVTTDQYRSITRLFIKIKDSYTTYFYKPAILTDVNRFELYSNKELIQSLPPGSNVSCK